MIVTVTMNPAIDKSTTVEKLIPEKKLRCAELLLDAGGGGINVSKALKKLGGESLAIFPGGGLNADRLEQILTQIEVSFKRTSISGETRENFSVTETNSNIQYRFVMPGHELTKEEIQNCFNTIGSLQPTPEIIVASGSLPPGVPDDFFAQLAVKAKQSGAKYIVDTSGLPLQIAAEEGVFLLKPNLTELCSLVGKDFLQLNEIEDAAKQIIEKGHCKIIVISMGPAGAILVTKDQYEKIPAPIVKKLSTVGAGDSMVAGMVWKLEQGKSFSEMVRFGVACGTAATMNAGTHLFNKEDVYELFDWINEQSHSNSKS
ncbi:MAG: 1-phosphofructokinase family hexose kinase [Bacteroidota bacterium]